MKWFKLRTDNFMQEKEAEIIRSGGARAYGIYLILLQISAQRITKDAKTISISLNELKFFSGEYRKKSVIESLEIVQRLIPNLVESLPNLGSISDQSVSNLCRISVECVLQVLDFPQDWFDRREEEERNNNKKNRIEKKETSIRFDSFLNDEQPKQPEAKQPEQPNNKKIKEIKVPAGSEEFVTLLNRFKIMDYKIRSSEEIIKKHFFGLARFEEFLKSVCKRDQFKIIESKSKLHADNYLNKAIRLEVGL